MAIVNNSEAIQNLIKAAKLQLSREKVPNFLSSGIMPTLEINPNLVKDCYVSYGSAVNATSGTIFATPSDRDTYIVAASVSVTKDATATSTRSSIQVVINGLNTFLCPVAGITLTAGSGTNSMAMPSGHAIKVDRGSTISIVNSTNVANVTSQGCVVYFIDETSKA